MGNMSKGKDKGIEKICSSKPTWFDSRTANGGTCIHSDDMQSILAQICKVDCLIFSFPLYAYGMPAPLKVIVDRLLPLSSYKMKSVGEGRYAHNTQADVYGYPKALCSMRPRQLQ